MTTATTDEAFLAGYLGDRLTQLLDSPTQYAQARDAFTRIAARECPGTARAWLISQNPHLGDQAPIDVIRAGHDISHVVTLYLTDPATN